VTKILFKQYGDNKVYSCITLENILTAPPTWIESRKSGPPNLQNFTLIYYISLSRLHDHVATYTGEYCNQ